jgi:hypothetical protein
MGVVNFDNCLMLNNSYLVIGGGVIFSNSHKMIMTVTNCLFDSNK